MIPTSTLLLRTLMLLAIGAAWLPIFIRPGASIWPAVVVSLVLVTLLIGYERGRRRGALRTIEAHVFPSFLRQKLQAAHPQLDDAALRQVERGLRQFFTASVQARGQFVAMPSKVVDTLWHEFILHTRGYEAFCRKAFGRMLHHTPAEALSQHGSTRARQRRQRAGLRLAWLGACRAEGLNPRRPGRLPLLFALDATLGIAGGYVYTLDCSKPGVGAASGGSAYCASELGCGGGSGGSGSGSDDDDGGSRYGLSHHEGGAADAGSDVGGSDASGSDGGSSSSGCGGGGSD